MNEPGKTEKKVNKNESHKAFVATSENVICATAHDVSIANTLLATAVVKIKSPNGLCNTIRALIDQGSMSSFISEKAVKYFGLSQTRCDISICGIAGSVEPSRGTTTMQITARYPSSFNLKTTAIVMNKLTSFLPNADFDRDLVKCDQMNDLILADPNFNKSAKIDMILGADVYSQIIMSGMIKTGENACVLQETEFGWIVSGPIGGERKKPFEPICMVATVNEIDETLRKFWEVEEIGEETVLTEEEAKSLEHFNSSIQKNSDGSYTVSLPFKENAEQLGNSKRSALAQFFQLERKFAKNESVRKLYIAYINELIERGYMRKCDVSDDNSTAFYLPHHPVFKDSVTTKLRPVFNAGAKTSNGISLNDILMTGPRLQEDIFDILVRFRLHKTAFSADIEKMYLHVNLNKSDQNYQRLLWRNDINEPISDYCLTTVTFGLNSSPFLAVATVQHHACSMMEGFPEACRIILQDSYMDDISSGCDSTVEAIRLQRQITNVLKCAGFPLRKWISNDEKLMKKIPAEEREGVNIQINENLGKVVSVLGVRWFFDCDRFGFKPTIKNDSTKLTKRAILSQMASTFTDPLGMLAPITIYNKILMQEVWKQNIGWDDEVNGETARRWEAFKSQVHIAEKITFPRWYGYESGAIVELHGFSDASERAYGACIYMKIFHGQDIHVNLVGAKTRVAPIDQISLPRLELCGAVLLAKLMRKVKTALKIPVHDIHYYCDSEITLAWLRKDARVWKTFVANRVATIQKLSERKNWHYINTKANPADFASRGLLPAELKENTLWWHGPSVLLNESNCAPEKVETKFETELEMRKNQATIFHSSIDTSMVDRFSDFNRAIRTVAFCKRFLGELTKRKALQIKSVDSDELRKQCLDVDELIEAKKTIIRMYQSVYFATEVDALARGIPLQGC